MRRFFDKVNYMDHLAIMKKSWGLLPKILNGEKTIESRWYKNKYSPWDKIKKGDTVYFKNSGELVTIKAEVSNVLQFSNLTPKNVKEILNEYGARDGLGIKEIDNYYQKFKDKNYCLLVFIKNPEKIKPFEINKKGFGAMCAWIAIDDINKIKL
jgi:ASC-1-like (ASCH) protein